MNNTDVFRPGFAVARPWATTFPSPTEVRHCRTKAGGRETGCVLFAVLALAFTQMASGALTNRYVIKDNAGSAPYDGWGNAAGDIQTAIDYAYAGETVLVAAATYDTGGITNWPAGTILTNRVVINKTITVQSSDNNPLTTIIMGAKDNGTNGPASVRCVYMTNGSALIGFTLTNGSTLSLNYPATGTNNDYHSGGGTWCQSTNTLISNCVLTVNSAARFGGGAYYGTLYDCTLNTNVAAHGGGGTYNSYLYACLLTNNVAQGGTLGGGVGAYGGYLYNCTIVKNGSDSTAGSGVSSGGGVNAAVTRDCRLYKNTTGTYGGGANGGTHYSSIFIDNVGGGGGGAMGATLYNCTMISNYAGYGGGAENCQLYNCQLTGNRGPTQGGGIYAGGATYASYNCTIIGNNAGTGGGVYGGRLYNCIVYFNDATTGSNSANVVSFTNCCTAPLPDTGEGNFTGNPSLIDPGSGYGASHVAGNYRLTINSPCVNAGTNLSWMTGSADVRSKDLDGHSRIDGFSRIVDMGAYEYLPSGIIFRSF